MFILSLNRIKMNKKIKSSTPSGSSIRVVSLLGVVFVALKLCGVIDWSWWFVTAPFWVPFVFLNTAF